MFPDRRYEILYICKNLWFGNGVLISLINTFSKYENIRKYKSMKI